MLLITYNINGFRAAKSKGLISWLEAVNADVVALQEVRAQQHQVDLEVLKAMGYRIFWNAAHRPGYSGVAVLTRLPIIEVHTQTGIHEIDREGRLIGIDFGGWILVNGYFPTGAAGPERMTYKLKFLNVLDDWLLRLQLDHDKPLVLVGDFNIAPSLLDVFNPIQFKEAAGCTLPELVWFEQFLKAGMVDCYRLFHPEQRAFTWWSYVGQARRRNLGWRIDHILASASLAPQLVRTEILSKAYHSDHAPVLAEFKGLSNSYC